MVAVQALTGCTIKEAVRAVLGCPVQVWGQFRRSPVESGASVLRAEVLNAILVEHHQGYKLEARQAAGEVARTATEAERDFVAWGLRECNRENAELVEAGLRHGHETQVNLPGFEWPRPKRAPPPPPRT